MSPLSFCRFVFWKFSPYSPGDFSVFILNAPSQVLLRLWATFQVVFFLVFAGFSNELLDKVAVFRGIHSHYLRSRSGKDTHCGGYVVFLVRNMGSKSTKPYARQSAYAVYLVPKCNITKASHKPIAINQPGNPRCSGLKNSVLFQSPD